MKKIFAGAYGISMIIAIVWMIVLTILAVWGVFEHGFILWIKWLITVIIYVAVGFALDSIFNWTDNL